MTYLEYISNRPIYDFLLHKAKRGLHKHHIVPIGKQMEDLGVRIDNFERDPRCDNRCIELSPSEHFKAHYLYAKEHPNSVSQMLAFSLMYGEMMGKEKFMLLSEEEVDDASRLFERSNSSKSEALKNFYYSEKGKIKLSDILKKRQSFYDTEEGKKVLLDMRKKESDTKRRFFATEEGKKVTKRLCEQASLKTSIRGTLISPKGDIIKIEGLRRFFNDENNQFVKDNFEKPETARNCLSKTGKYKGWKWIKEEQP